MAIDGSDLSARGRVVPVFEEIAIAAPAIATWLDAGRQITELALEVPESAHISARPAACVSRPHRRLGRRDSVRAAPRAIASSLWPRPRAAPSERSSCWPTTTFARGRWQDADALEHAAVLVTIGQLSRGFHLPAAHLRVYAESDLFEEERRPHERRRSASRAFLSDFRDLKVGDLVVHVDNGIGRFVGPEEDCRRRKSRRAGVHGTPLCRR
jgi:hypothetical protein